MGEDSEARTRVAAAKAISRVQPDSAPKAADIIVVSLWDKDPAFRMSAGEGLEIMQEAAMPHTAALVAALEDDVPSVRLAVTNALTAAGRSAVKPNGAAVANVAKTDPDPYVRRAAVAALRKFMLTRRFGID